MARPWLLVTWPSSAKAGASSPSSARAARERPAVRRVTPEGGASWSWPGLTRPWRSTGRLVRRAADGRVRPGHDRKGTMLLHGLGGHSRLVCCREVGDATET